MKIDIHSKYKVIYCTDGIMSNEYYAYSKYESDFIYTWNGDVLIDEIYNLLSDDNIESFSIIHDKIRIRHVTPDTDFYTNYTLKIEEIGG